MGFKTNLQSVEDLATWVNFSSFHGKDWELRDIVAGYGCIDLFVEESKGAFAYMGPRLHRERDTNSTFFTWEYQVWFSLFVHTLMLVLIPELFLPLRGMVTTAKQCQLAKLMRYTLFWRGFY